MEVNANQSRLMTTNDNECPYCGRPLEARILEFQGHTIPAGYKECHCPGAEEARRAEEAEELHKAELAAIEKRKKKIAATGIPPRFQEVTADVDRWLPVIRAGRSLVFYSDTPGSGKTHLACAIGLALLDEMSVRFTSIGRIKSDILSHVITDAEMLRSLEKYDLLILDDLDKVKPSEWVVELIYAIINKCYEDMRPMIITTNCNMEGLESFMTVDGNNKAAKSIVSRIRGMCGGPPIPFEEEDRRLNNS